MPLPPVTEVIFAVAVYVPTAIPFPSMLKLIVSPVTPVSAVAVGCCSFGDFSSRDLNRTQRWFHIDRRDLSKNSRANSNEYDDLQ